MKRRVYLAQVSHEYNRQLFLPYTVGLLEAYAKTIPEIADNYDFGGYCCRREPFQDVVSRWQKPDVVGLSVYIWNARYSLALAKAIKEANPSCLVVVGGPHIPVRSADFFREHPYVDIIVHYEGEEAFADILKERLWSDPEYTRIPGLSVQGLNHTAITTKKRERTLDIDKLPSPYLTGVFDNFDFTEFSYHSLLETNRGCPYSCTFCDWGSSVFQKMRKFDDKRIFAEIDWMADHKIDLLYGCDSNFGIFERDVAIAEKMAEAKRRTGFPNKFRTSYAKNSNDRVYQIAKIFNETNQNKGITLSFQSMDDHTLDVIKRKNIKIKDFKNLMRRYNSENIPTYSEIIVGLAGETYDSFANGLNTLLENGAHSSLSVYCCELLPNAEMADPAYRQKHGIKSVVCPVLVYHGTPAEDPYNEEYEIVTETATLSQPDWQRCQLLAWIVQGCHCLPLLQAIAVFCYTRGVTYRQFYEGLLAFMDANPHTLAAEVYAKAKALFLGIPEGKAWGVVDQRFGNITWPPEEWAFLALSVDRDRFYKEIMPFLDSLIQDAEMRDQLLDYQKALVIDPYQSSDPQFLGLKWNLHEFIQGVCQNEEPELKNELSVYLVQKEDFKGDLHRFGRHVWFNRKGGNQTNTFKPRPELHQFFPRGAGPLVSVLIPTRGRVPYLLQSVDSLWSLAMDKEIEFIFKADTDDEPTIAAIKHLSNIVPVKALVSPRGNGYKDLHVWVNEMAAMAEGDWILVWNDDAVMKTVAWDQMIRYCGTSRQWEKCWDVCLLVMATIGRPVAHEFVLVRRKVYEILGHLSLSQHTDNWLYSVLKHVEAVLHIPVFVNHFSHMMTDDTRKNSEEAYKTTIETLNSFSGRRERIADMVKLLDYMEGV